MHLRIQYISDVHLEHRGEVPFDQIGVEAPVLVLAGDLGHLSSRSYRVLLEWANENFETTLLVLGNHEYYGQKMTETEARIKALVVDLPRVHWLHRSTYDHPSGVRFVGATLWSQVTVGCFFALMDQKHILWDADTPFTREHYLALHREDVAFFEQAIATADRPLVCISHHAPLLEMNGSFGDNPYRSGFCTDLSRLVRAPVRAWINGHTHQSLRVDVDGIPCVSNCLGYPRERGAYPGFRKGATIDLEFSRKSTIASVDDGNGERSNTHVRHDADFQTFI